MQSSKIKKNSEIKAEEVLVIDSYGKSLGVYAIKEAIDIAISSDMDLILVNEKGNTPVCKIADYGKFVYEFTKKEKKNKKKRIETKEIQLSMSIGQQDMLTKAKAAKKFLEEGNNVRVLLRMRGREALRVDEGKEVINRFLKEIEDYGNIDGDIRAEERFISLIVKPKRN